MLNSIPLKETFGLTITRADGPGVGDHHTDTSVPHLDINKCTYRDLFEYLSGSAQISDTSECLLQGSDADSDDEDDTED